MMATGGLSAPNRPNFPGHRHLRRHDRADEPLARGGRRARGQAHRHRRHGLVRRAGHPRAGQGGGAPHRVPAHRRVHVAVAEQAARPTRSRPRSRPATASCATSSGVSFSGTAGTTGAVILHFATDDRRILESTPEEREAVLDEHGFSACRIWADTAKDLDANEMAVELFREMIRRTVRDPRRRRVAVTAWLPARLQAARARHRLLRDVQPRQRVARRPPQGPHRGGHADRHPHDAGLRRARRDRPRHRFRRDDRRAHPHRRTRPRRPPAARRLGRRAPDVPRRQHGRLPEPLRRRRSGQPGRARHLPAADRAAGRLDRRLRAPPERARASPAPRPRSTRRTRGATT